VTRRAIVLFGSLLKALVMSLGLAAAAGATVSAGAAECPGTPSASPYSFTGTVTQVRSHGLIATVRTEGGQNVEVRSGRSADSTTSEARRYAVGGVYEFHPTNSTSPFIDDACTATRQLSGPQYDPSMDSGGIPFGPPLFFAALFFALLIGIPWLVRRGRRQPPAGSVHEE
jgi:hypothetical protein